MISNEDVSKIVGINDDGDLPGFAATKIRGLYEVAEGALGLEARLEEIFAEVDDEIENGRPADRAVRPRRQPAARADPEPAAHQRRAPPPDPQPRAHQDRPRRRVR